MRTPHLRAVSAPQTLQVALYARVSSDQQAEHHTIDSQLAELAARAEQDGHCIRDDLRFIDNGHSGASLIRPALERLRDLVALSAIDLVYILSPDRLARSPASQVHMGQAELCTIVSTRRDELMGWTAPDPTASQCARMVLSVTINGKGSSRCKLPRSASTSPRTFSRFMGSMSRGRRSCAGGCGAISFWGLFKRLEPCLIGIEACATAHHWAR